MHPCKLHHWNAFPIRQLCICSFSYGYFHNPDLLTSYSCMQSRPPTLIAGISVAVSTSFKSIPHDFYMSTSTSSEQGYGTDTDGKKLCRRSVTVEPTLRQP